MVIVSKTGVIKGRGTDRYKWVSGLTPEERQAVREGETVLVPDNSTHPNTTDYKIVVKGWGGGFTHRNYYGKN